MDWQGEVSGLYNQYVHEKTSFFTACSAGLVDSLPAKEHLRVLDLAGGAGVTSRLILTKYPDAQITILDSSAEQLEHARHVFRDAATYVQSRAELYTPEQHFDVIICANAFMYLQHSIIVKVASWLAPGGVFVFNLHEQNTTLKDASFLSAVYLQIDALSRERYRTSCLIYQRITHVDELKGLLHAAGFSVVERTLAFEEPHENWKVFCELEARRTTTFMALSIPPEQKLQLFRDAFKLTTKQLGKIDRHSLLFVCTKNN